MPQQDPGIELQSTKAAVNVEGSSPTVTRKVMLAILRLLVRW